MNERRATNSNLESNAEDIHQNEGNKEKLRHAGDVMKFPDKQDNDTGKTSFGVNFFNFCQNTSLHGFRYIASGETSIIERVIWSLICLIFLILATLMMINLVNQFAQTPTTTTIETTAYPIWDFSFPAVTICNHNKVYLPAAKKLKKDLLENGLKQEDIDRVFDLLPQLIRPSLGNGNMTHVPDVLKFFNMTIEELMFKLMQPCDKMLLTCTWLDKKYDCNKIFKASKSTEGFCCSFNYHVRWNKFLRVDEINRNNSNVNETEDKNLPGVDEHEDVPGAGRDYGLVVSFDVEKQYYRGTIRPYFGASIMLHNPYEFPEVDLRSVIIQPSQEVTILLSGTMIESESRVRNLPIGLRNCVFEDEKKLNISSKYRYQSCVSQCRIKFIAKNCYCIPFYYPHIYPEKRICGLDDISCLQSIRKNISELQTVGDVNSYIDDIPDDFIPDCNNCFPLCDDSWYTLNTESAYMDNNLMMLNGLDVDNISTAAIFFRDITCIKYKRDKWKNWHDVIASLGGVLGLCVGGSFVSVVEIIYFFIINKIFKRKVKNKLSESIINIKNALNNDDNPKISKSQQNTLFVGKKISPVVKVNKRDEVVEIR